MTRALLVSIGLSLAAFSAAFVAFAPSAAACGPYGIDAKQLAVEQAALEHASRQAPRAAHLYITRYVSSSDRVAQVWVVYTLENGRQIRQFLELRLRRGTWVVRRAGDRRAVT